MDRTAWIVVALCVVGLLLWEFYFAKQMAPRPAPVTAASGHASPTPSLAVRVPSPSPLATPEALPQGVETAPIFAEKVEALRNSDVELRLTNRGGGIAEAVMLSHLAEDAKRVVLNSAKHIPIGAMVDDPAKPVLPEFVLSRESESSIRCERATPDGITVRKRFSLTQTADKKDDFVVDLDVDVLNTVAQPYAKATGIWGRSFEVSADRNMFGIEGAMRMPGFNLQPGQTYTARFQIWEGPKIYHRLAHLEQNEAEIMNFGVFKIVSQFL